MSARTVEQHPLHVARTGWSKARHRQGKGVRTCVRAVGDDAPVTARTDVESNIVRGED
ncbi:hypothetical protein [Streptomyces sp. MBT62]|uniref:hypothetical protein n=1 Tax=Streptomyces sp. MBT62 TaxID=2800410 RepID=UPI00190DD72B|nr:hypothetical protein [Streptomyces sp. MBT62]MBK3564840.1 hypothetical protein [Streptomyces sp. MBT62]